MLRILKAIGSLILDFVDTIVPALVLFVVLYIFFLQPHQVKGNSMQPNFQSGENLLTNKIIYRFSEPKRGDILIFKSPQNKKQDYIKRIIGLPGEKISLKLGHVYINNDLLDESPYLPPNILTNGASFLPEGGEVLIPEEQFFVAGDNRSHSSDSREWGFIEKKDIIGKAWIRYWPPSKFSLLSITAR